MGKQKVSLPEYPFEIRRLSDEDGGGYLINYPDFSECFSDGETIQEALVNGAEALEAVIETLEAKGVPVPMPGSGGTSSGRFVQRVPKSVHARLAERARAEGVSLNTLVLTFIAEGLGRRETAKETGGPLWIHEAH